MTILAQQWLEDHAPTEFDYWLEARLRLPTKSADVEGAEYAAERVVFENTLCDVIANLMDSGQLGLEVVLQTVRMPCPAIWVEWPHMDVRFGVLLDQGSQVDGPVAVTIVSGKRNSACTILYAGTLTSLPVVAGAAPVAHLGFSAMGPVSAPQTQEFFISTVVEALFAVFLLQQPKVIVQQKVQHSPALQKARFKHQRLPLLEYRRVHVLVGQTATPAIGERSGQPGGYVGSTGRKRYHRVLGHFRVYGRETPTPKACWVEPFFRGDPKLGILLHERNLRTGEISE